MKTEILKVFIYKNKSINEIENFEQFLKSENIKEENIRYLTYIIDNNLYKLNVYCLIEIIKGLKKNLDVSWYAKPEFD